MSKWIKFSRPRKSKSGKTQIWRVTSNDDDYDVLGKVFWYGRWRKYSFEPAVFTVFEQDCLRKIAQFCEDESKKLRQKWRQRQS